MIPILILFLIFFLAQAQADEFPNLLKHVDVTWGDQLLTSQLNTRQTMSIDRAVPSFILCGPFKTSGGDGQCRLKYHYDYSPSTGTWSKGSGSTSTIAKLISTINETYSCMNFEMPMLISDFVTLYQNTEQFNSHNNYDLSYECETIAPIVTQPGVSPSVYLVIAFVVTCIFGFICYTSGKKADISNGNGIKVTTRVNESSSATSYSYQKEWTLTF